MNIGNINQNIAGQSANTGKASFARASDPKDVFVKSSPGEPEPSLKNLAQKLSVNDAGKILMADKKDLRAAFGQTIEKPEWEVRGGIPFNSDMVYDPKNKCFYGGLEDLTSSGREKHHLTCLNTDGSIRWKFDGDDFKQGPILDGDGNVYFTGKHNLHAIDKDGNEKWNVRMESLDAIEAKPIIAPDGTVFAVDYINNANENTAVHAVKDGEVRWTYSTSGWDKNENSMFVAKDGSLYIAAKKQVVEKGFFSDKTHVENFFIGVQPNGAQKFKIPVEDWPIATTGSINEGPDGTIYTLQKDGRLKAYAPDGTEKFSKQITRKGKQGGKGSGLSLPYPPAIDDFGNIYLVGEASWKSDLICLNKNGDEIWRYEGEKKFTTKPHFAADGTIAIAMDDEHIHMFDRTGNPTKKFLVGGEERSNRIYGNNMLGDFSVLDNFAFDERGRMVASAGSWVLAFDTQADPMDQITGNTKEAAGNPQQDNTIKMEEENVVIGGVKVRRNKIE